MGTTTQKRYREAMSARVRATGPGHSKGSMTWNLYYGTKGQKPITHRRPHKGGKVHS